MSRLHEILAAHLCVQREIIEPHSMLIDDLGADSLDLVELEYVLSDEFAITIEDDDLRNHTTVGDIERLIERKVAAK